MHPNVEMVSSNLNIRCKIYGSYLNNFNNYVGMEVINYKPKIYGNNIENINNDKKFDEAP